jgi:hypothetical protein
MGSGAASGKRDSVVTVPVTLLFHVPQGFAARSVNVTGSRRRAVEAKEAGG